MILVLMARTHGNEWPWTKESNLPGKKGVSRFCRLSLAFFSADCMTLVVVRFTVMFVWILTCFCDLSSSRSSSRSLQYCFNAPFFLSDTYRFFNNSNDAPLVAFESCAISVKPAIQILHAFTSDSSGALSKKPKWSADSRSWCWAR